MVSCVICGCSRTTKSKIDGVTFHRFPKNIEIRKVWTDFVNPLNWTPGKNTFLCSQHFDQNCFDNTSKSLRRLKEGAIPSINVHRVKFARCLFPIVQSAKGVLRSDVESLSHLKGCSLNIDTLPQPLSNETDNVKTQSVTSSVISESSMKRPVVELLSHIKNYLPKIMLLSQPALNETDKITPQSSTSSIACETSMKKPDVELLPHLKEYASKIMIVSQPLSDETDNITPQSSTSSVVTGTSKLECTAIQPDDTPRTISLKRKIHDLSFTNVIKNQKIRRLQQMVWRQKKRITMLRTVINDLKKEIC